MKFCCAALLFLGRLCISAIFLLSGIGKFIDFEGTSKYMAAKGLPLVPVLLVVAALVEIFSSLSLIVGFKTRFAAFVLFLFLIPATYIFHDFWNAAPEAYTIQFLMFMKNLAIGGGLLYIMGAGAGGFAVENCCCSTQCRVEPKESVEA